MLVWKEVGRAGNQFWNEEPCGTLSPLEDENLCIRRCPWFGEIVVVECTSQ